MPLIGVRIEFYDKPSHDIAQESEGYLGAVHGMDHFEARTVPAAGELLSTTSLTPVFPDRERQGLAAVFLPVRYVEHWFKPLDGEPPHEDGVCVVVHARVPYAGPALRDFVRCYLDAGWHATAKDGTELEQAITAERADR